ncbi:hypothetical protein PMG11_10016 [Penicillium brasilianum]|uniref:N-acetyltransferase domain-containing protein n=1 Tax=Penicillium brasilianum TaxID=104259 RepID=A0A0F7TXW6_PENBI|nr:hypothetical protein PMG11_10016 [Penicillium brasilianum]
MAASKSSSLDFKILPATEADCATVATIEAISNCNASKTEPKNNLSLVLFGPPGDSSFRAKDLASKLENDKTARIWKAVISDENAQEKIIAISLWHYYVEPKVIEDWKDIEWPAGAHQEGCNTFLRTTVAMRKKHMSGKEFGHLQVLATLPEYRGYGIGSALIKKGLEEGVEKGLVDFWLESSNDGHALYEKFGFQDVEPVVMDLAQYGGEGLAPVRTMRRVPN